MKKLTYECLNCGGNPRKGYTLVCSDEEFNHYELFVPPDTIEVISLEFLTGKIPWDKDLPIKGGGSVILKKLPKEETLYSLNEI